MENNLKYDQVNDAIQQLDKTIVLNKVGIPVYLRNNDNTWKWRVEELGTYEEKIVDIRKEQLNLSPIQLGYCNYTNNCAYLIRRPVRMWKQGLAYEHILSKSGYIEDGIMTSDFLMLTILNNFPNIQEIYTWLSNKKRKGGYSRAFHRDFALTTVNLDRIHIEHKGEIIGFILQDGNLNINEEYFYLKEYLDEVINAKD